MSTIASPRQSISLSSQRTSIDTQRSASVSRGGNAPPRKNRSALRDYYNLPGPSPPAPPPITTTATSELDAPSFDPAVYVQGLLTTSSLENVLKTSAKLDAEIRNLDGEKKALVYDNYAKLIAATDTIRRMREEMGPLAPMTQNVEADVGRIAETAGEIDRKMREARSGQDGRGQRETVKWVLDAPSRLERLVGKGEKEKAEEQWAEVSALLARWQGVKGVEEVRTACMQAMKREQG